MTGLPFTVVHSEYAENNNLDMAPAELVQHLALGKARWVADRHPEDLVIGADSLVFLGDRVLGKPSDKDELAEMIAALSGQTNQVHTGYAIVQGDRVVTGSTRTDITMREITPGEMEAYMLAGDTMDKAGGYAMQGSAAAFIERTEGDYLGAVGLSLYRMVVELREFGFTPKFG